jgi:hypothetical protein
MPQSSRCKGLHGWSRGRGWKDLAGLGESSVGKVLLGDPTGLGESGSNPRGDLGHRFNVGFGELDRRLLMGILFVKWIEGSRRPREERLLEFSNAKVRRSSMSARLEV